jgi:surface protein
LILCAVLLIAATIVSVSVGIVRAKQTKNDNTTETTTSNSSGSNNGSSVASPIPVSSPVSSPTTLITSSLPYFTSTAELYQAVDIYVEAVYYSGNGEHGDKSNETAAAAAALDAVLEQYGAMADWDVSRLSDLSYVFYRGNRDRAAQDMALSWPSPSTTIPTTLFNEDIGGWNTSLATTMQGMFNSATAFDGDLGGWDVVAVKNFSGMFMGCSAFTGKGLSNWDTSAAQDMSFMFSGAKSLVSTDDSSTVSRWSVERVNTFEAMFHGSTRFNENLSLWNTSRATNMASMVRMGQGHTWRTMGRFINTHVTCPLHSFGKLPHLTARWAHGISVASHLWLTWYVSPPGMRRSIEKQSLTRYSHTFAAIASSLMKPRRSVGTCPHGTLGS